MPAKMPAELPAKMLSEEERQRYSSDYDDDDEENGADEEEKTRRFEASINQKLALQEEGAKEYIEVAKAHGPQWTPFDRRQLDIVRMRAKHRNMADQTAWEQASKEKLLKSKLPQNFPPGLEEVEGETQDDLNKRPSSKDNVTRGPEKAEGAFDQYLSSVRSEVMQVMALGRGKPEEEAVDHDIFIRMGHKQPPYPTREELQELDRNMFSVDVSAKLPFNFKLPSQGGDDHQRNT
jgi:hypothetical protein